MLVDNLSDQGCLFLLLRLGRARVSVTGDVSIGTPGCLLRLGKLLYPVGISSSPDEGAGVEVSLEKIIYAWQGFRPLQTRMLILPSELPG